MTHTRAVDERTADRHAHARRGRRPPPTRAGGQPRRAMGRLPPRSVNSSLARTAPAVYFVQNSQGRARADLAGGETLSFC